MNPTTQSPTNSVHPARQQRIWRLPEVKAKTGFGRSTIYTLMAAGYLVPDGNRPQRKVSLPDNTRPRMYCVKGSILDD